MTRAGLFILVLLAALGLGATAVVDPLDRQLLDLQFRWLRAHAPRAIADANADVVIVGIDDATTQVLREPLTLWHPHIGRFLEAATRAGARAIGLDIVLPDRSFETLAPGYDRQLLAGLLIARREVPLVLALTVDPAGNHRPLYPAFLAAAGDAGYALLPVDPDGIVRRFDERMRMDGGAVPTLAGRLAERLDRPVGHGIIDYGAGAAFTYLPLHAVLAWQDAGDTAELERAFHGKVVLLGGVFKFEDRLRASANLLAWDPEAANAPGVVLHAQVLRNLLGDGLVQPVPMWMVTAVAVLAAFAFWAVGRGVIAALVVVGVVAVVGAVVAGSTWLLAHGTHLPMGVIVLTLAIAVATRLLYEAELQLRERRRLQHAFSAYVSPDIMREILRTHPPPGLGGARYFLCILFADIRGFTARSERATPEATIRVLNRFFSEFTACVHDAGGTLDKFIGDGLMAFFGAPQKLANPCQSAVDAAQAMLERLPALNAALAAEGEAPIAIGIGLSAGDAVVGNMGSESRNNYTAIGDAVNVASRLEGLTRDVDYPLVCSAQVFERLDDRAGFVKLGLRDIRGHAPVEVCGWRPAAAGDAR